jgi:hypothetical protein
VRSEEERFAGAQSRATALLAVSGVIAGLGGTFAVQVDSRSFPWQVNAFGASVPVAPVIIITLGAICVVSLLWTGILALGAMEQSLDLNSDPSFLRSLIGEQFPGMLHGGTEQSSRAILSLLADQLEVAQEANRKTNDALRRSAIRLGISVAAGIALTVFILASPTPGHQREHMSSKHHLKLVIGPRNLSPTLNSGVTL